MLYNESLVLFIRKSTSIQPMTRPPKFGTPSRNNVNKEIFVLISSRAACGYARAALLLGCVCSPVLLAADWKGWGGNGKDGGFSAASLAIKETIE